MHRRNSSQDFDIASLTTINSLLKAAGRPPYPILEPETDYERVGLVPNVVFPCGNVVIGDALFVYYGAADKHCCVATCLLDTLVDAALAHPI